MPHFVIHCSEEVLDTLDEMEINKEVHSVANASGLFEEGDIKVRVQAFSKYLVGGDQGDIFIHVFASIMQGRTEVQRANLAQAIVRRLVELFPSVTNIAMNVDEFMETTYCNKSGLS